MIVWCSDTNTGAGRQVVRMLNFGADDTEDTSRLVQWDALLSDDCHRLLQLSQLTMSSWALPVMGWHPVHGNYVLSAQCCKDLGLASHPCFYGLKGLASAL